ncbi:TolC family protein [Sediminibacterium sp.]|uniref:TolC family protein n=1 Tax=Sediminibacterium sp. TaxID=1917865 RepID=UPI00272FBECC|nr:TolC family protein [Sediminibacterium sp.]MDP2421379.1 TolC family protein [Sediminibacterium sp.]
MKVKYISIAFISLVWSQSVIGQRMDNDLKLLINEAFNNSHQLKINIYKTAQVQINRTMAKQTFLPKISNSATYTRLNDDIAFPQDTKTLLLGTQGLLIKEALSLPFNATLPSQVKLKPVPIIQSKDIFKITSGAQWILFSGFKASLSAKATQHQEKGLSFLSQIEKINIAKDVWETYDKLALVNASEQVIKATDNYLDEQLRFVEEAIKNGLATPLEREKVNLARQKLTLKKIEVQGNKELLIDKLSMVTLQEKTSLALLNPTIAPLFFTDTITVERPELKALNENIQAIELKRKIELTEYIPKIAAFGQYEWRKQNLSLFEPRWFAGARLQWTMFDGLTAKKEARKTAIEKNILLEQKKDAEEKISLAVSKAEVDERTAGQKMIMAKQSAALAERIKLWTEKQFKNGLTSIRELLDAVAEQEKAQQDSLTAIFEQRRAVASLLEAKGRLLFFLQ